MLRITSLLAPEGFASALWLMARLREIGEPANHTRHFFGREASGPGCDNVVSAGTMVVRSAFAGKEAHGFPRFHLLGSGRAG